MDAEQRGSVPSTARNWMGDWIPTWQVSEYQDSPIHSTAGLQGSVEELRGAGLPGHITNAANFALGQISKNQTLPSSNSMAASFCSWSTEIKISICLALNEPELLEKAHELFHFIHIYIYIRKSHNSRCPVSTSGCHTSIPDILCPCGQNILHFKQPQEQKFCSHGGYFSITLLNLILILPSVLWTVAKLCTCGRKLPRTAPCKTGQQRVAPQAAVTPGGAGGSSSSLAGVEMVNVTPQGPGKRMLLLQQGGKATRRD